MTEPAPGWAAIDAAFRRLYGDQEPRHWGTLIRWSMGGPDPLDGISCWEAEGHWHFVGYGLSELYEKTSGVPEQSGFGFELTFRLARRAGETAPPEWSLGLLQGLARYVFRSGNVLRPGEHVDVNGPLGGDESTALCALAFTEDPELGSIESPHGRVRFVQVVGITGDELDAMKDWNTEGVLGLVAREHPLLVTELGRRSVREDPANEAAIQGGIARDGSAAGASVVEELDWHHDADGSLRLRLGAIAIPDLGRVLRGRIPFGRAFRLVGPSRTVVFWPAGVRESAEEADDGVVFVELTPEQAEAMRDGLVQRAGTYTWPEVDGLTLEIVPTEIRDASGEVVRVLG